MIMFDVIFLNGFMKEIIGYVVYNRVRQQTKVFNTTMKIAII